MGKIRNEGAGAFVGPTLNSGTTSGGADGTIELKPQRVSPLSLEARVAEYQRTAEAALGDQIARELSPLVEAITSRIFARVPRMVLVDRDDLHQAGALGLVQALKSFDPGRGVQFNTYASRRIEGAMIDALRAIDPLPREKREACRQIAAARDELLKIGFSNPNDEQILALTSFSGDEYRKVVRLEATSRTVSLDGPCDPSDAASSGGTGASATALQREFWDEIERRLEPKEAQALLGTEVHGKSPEQLARQLGVSRTRVNGLKHAAVERLRETFLQPVTGSSFIAAVREKWAPVTES